MALSPYDLFDVRSLLSDEERAVQEAVARFTDERVLPIIGEAFDQGRFPKELVAEVASLGLLGSSLPEEYGCAGLNAVSYGLICQELERGDLLDLVAALVRSALDHLAEITGDLVSDTLIETIFSRFCIGK